ncbi:hypothetical protein V6N11_081283 [Hibiscus sabdariffa]|uniref:Pentatricopeptide repeat-containing protein n=1 Tax=Hibiscus sabdariffa TaxID=183260 RepID=A0ABR2QJD3_9ROSI
MSSEYGLAPQSEHYPLAEEVADSVLQFHPQDSSAYFLLSNIYADVGLWDKVSYMTKMMRYNKLKKEPGCSWIEIKDEAHAFLGGEKAHPRCKEIYEPQPPSDTNQALRAGTASITIEHRMNGSLRLLVKDYGYVNIWPTSIISTEMRFVVHHYFMKDAS